jgi:hypothetical protein
LRGEWLENDDGFIASDKKVLFIKVQIRYLTLVELIEKVVSDIDVDPRSLRVFDVPDRDSFRIFRCRDEIR